MYIGAGQASIAEQFGKVDGVGSTASEAVSKLSTTRESRSSGSVFIVASGDRSGRGGAADRRTISTMSRGAIIRATLLRR